MWALQASRRWRDSGSDAVGEASLPAYSHVCSPKKFTQHQLFACLVLKSFLRLDYRGIVIHLADCPSLTEAIGFEQIPALHDAAKSCGSAAECSNGAAAVVRQLSANT